MITRSRLTKGESRHDDTLTASRQALFEDASLLNRRTSKATRPTGDMAVPGKSVETTKTKHLIISASSAKREPRGLHSPAKRSVVRSPSRPCLATSYVDISTSPSKRLGAPRRGPSSRSACCLNENALQLNPSVAPFSSESMFAPNGITKVSPSEELSVCIKQAHTSVPVSPLKKPPRRNLHSVKTKPISTDYVSDVRTPARSRKPRTRTLLTVEVPTSNDDADESTSPTSEKVDRKSGMRRTREGASSRSHTPLTMQSTHLTVDDVDELAMLSFTPLKVPDLPSHAVSPPSEEIFEDEDDHWSPSVPSAFTKSLADLSLLDRWSNKESSNVGHQSPPAVSPVSQCDSDLVIFVDCKTNDQGETSQHFSSLLATLGARVVQRWNWNPDTQGTPSKRSKVIVTHVVFFNGSTRTLKKVNSARKLGIHVICVGLSWVSQCVLSERLTIGTAGHEIDVAHEMVLRGAASRALNLQPLIDTDHKRTQAPIEIPVSLEAQPSAHVSDISVPVVFNDTHDTDSKQASPLTTPPKPPASISSSAKLTSKTKHPQDPCMSEFETRNILLARRNSAKFQPMISSPLSKRAWKA